MPDRRTALTPDALLMMDAIARTGSFAAAARELGKVPSALTYSVRQLEDALDVLLFDRRSRQAKPTAAGEELLAEGRRLLAEMDAVANRVRRVATGWETQLTVAADGVLSRLTLLELCEAFYALRPDEAEQGPGTRLRLRTEVLAGTWEALVSGQADLALGVPLESAAPGIELAPLGDLPFVFAVAPHHPLAALPEPLPDDAILRHRAVAVADSAQRLSPITVNLLPGQDVLTVSSMQAKIEAQLRCLGCGFVPEPLVRDHLRGGRLVAKTVQRQRRQVRLGYAWRAAAVGSRRQAPQGLALQWWLQQLESPATRRALLERHCGLPSDVD
ncbi:LysR family transcriptional regulator [Ideonella sp. 4Y16]|uniref:LysR family transcriptional regulator n=1 Tax=Ideonella alba TaxID=2824118 RepID=UPI001B39A384|nr:LysR family transcriptional regulator [Ideonella alba]MBQ0945957.1 LysR family transcriptional regulator [Ideonella alba]